MRIKAFGHRQPHEIDASMMVTDDHRHGGRSLQVAVADF
jgi:hypothetical protein